MTADDRIPFMQQTWLHTPRLQVSLQSQRLCFDLHFPCFSTGECLKKEREGETFFFLHLPFHVGLPATSPSLAAVLCAACSGGWRCSLKSITYLTFEANGRNTGCGRKINYVLSPPFLLSSCPANLQCNIAVGRVCITHLKQ